MQLDEQEGIKEARHEQGQIRKERGKELGSRGREKGKEEWTFWVIPPAVMEEFHGLDMDPV